MWFLFRMSQKGSLWVCVKTLDQLHAPGTLHVTYWNFAPINPASRRTYWFDPVATLQAGACTHAFWYTVNLTESRHARCQAM